LAALAIARYVAGRRAHAGNTAGKLMSAGVPLSTATD
jgi:hypothetical protein